MVSGWAGGRQEKVIRPVSQKLYGVGSRYLVGTLVRGRRCAMSWCDLDLTFDLAAVTLSLKILSGYISETVRSSKLILGRYIG